jgi:hypothetical protein
MPSCAISLQQEGVSGKMSLVLAILAVAVSAFAKATLILWYVATSAAITVGVINLFTFGLLAFVNGMIWTDSGHFLGSPLKDLGTPKVRPGRAFYRSQLFQQPLQCGPMLHLSPQLF